jgi:hypothetical protein
MIRIKISLSEYGLGQLIEDLAYVAGETGEGKQDILQPLTITLLREIVRKAGNKAAGMVWTGNRYLEICESGSLEEAGCQTRSEGGEDNG